MSDYLKYLRSLVPDTDSESESNTSSIVSKNNKRKFGDNPENGDGQHNMQKKPRIETHLFGEGQENSSTESGQDEHTENSPSPSSTRGTVPFQQGTNIFSDSNVEINVQLVEHQRHTRFRAEDHLYQVKIRPNRRTSPLLLSLETALKEALSAILERLQNNYPPEYHHQVYITIIENKIKHGLNTGNYDLAAPPSHIVNRALTILHSYLKSNQTMKLSDSFKVQIKVLSHNHTRYLEANNPRFTKKTFRDYNRIRN